MDPQLMWLDDYLETEKEKTRYVTRISLAQIVLIQLERDGGPDLEQLKETLRDVIATAEANLKYLRSLEEPDERTDPETL
jgi:hypothetical protein